MSHSAMSMPPIAAMTLARCPRGSGGGRPSRPNIPPTRGEVIANSSSHRAACASGSRPLSCVPSCSTQRQTSGSAGVWIWPYPSRPSSVVTATMTVDQAVEGSCAVQTVSERAIRSGKARVLAIRMTVSLADRRYSEADRVPVQAGACPIRAVARARVQACCTVEWEMTDRDGSEFFEEQPHAPFVSGAPRCAGSAAAALPGRHVRALTRPALDLALA